MAIVASALLAESLEMIEAILMRPSTCRLCRGKSYLRIGLVIVWLCEKRVLQLSLWVCYPLHWYRKCRGATMNKSTGKEWQTPSVSALDAKKTQGGIIADQPESTVFGQSVEDGSDVTGSDFGGS